MHTMHQIAAASMSALLVSMASLFDGLASDMEFTDARNGWWVVPTKGEHFRIPILHTADGGKNWAPQDSGTRVVLGSVHFADARHGWALELPRDGKLAEDTYLHTADGGRNWARMPFSLREPQEEGDLPKGPGR